MEKLLHYVWQHKLFASPLLKTDNGQCVEVIDPGLHNTNAGPDFFNAKVRIGNMLWAGNVEIHLRSSDWFKHKHHTNVDYDNTVLHVVEEIDCEATTAAGEKLPQVKIEVPQYVVDNYKELLSEEAYPPCYRAIPNINTLNKHAWMSALTTERLAEKTLRIQRLQEETNNNWEQIFFITLARSFGFGVNAEAFEQWARLIPPSAVGKHRDHRFQVEAFFFGQAGLLADELVPPERRDDYFLQLQSEYRFLAHKFSLTPMDGKAWKFLRMRPQNFPHIRLAQLVDFYHRQEANFSKIIEPHTPEELRRLLSASTFGYWETHYSFGKESQSLHKALQPASLDLILINAIAPLLFAYGRYRMDESRSERAFCLLEQIKAETNHITRSWQAAGLKAENAADSQALIQLKQHYCDKKDCLRCRFGAYYLLDKSKQ